MSNDKWLENQEDMLPQGLNARDVSLERMLKVDLSKSHDQEQINPYGNCDLFLVTEISGEAYVQFNRKDAPKIPIHRVPKIKRKFDEIYLTNDEQPNSSFSALLGGDLEGNKESLDAASLSEMSDSIEILDTVGLKPVDLKFIDDDLAVILNSDEVGLFKTSDFTESRTIDGDNVGLFKTNDFTENRTIDGDNVGLFKTSDFTESRTIDGDNVGLIKTSDLQQMENLQISLVNEDVNLSTFEILENEVKFNDEVYYSFSGEGSFDVTVEWTDGNGNVLKTHTQSSSDGSEINQQLTQKSNHVSLKIEDTSGAINPITGTFNVH